MKRPSSSGRSPNPPPRLSARAHLPALVAGALIALSGATARVFAASPADLVAAERDFAARVREDGVRRGFLAWLAPDGRLFHPRPVIGRTVYERQTDRPGWLAWAPEFAEIARSGDLGWTTGPWEFRADPAQADPVATGHFVTVWARQMDGSWKVAIDLGTDHSAEGPLPREARLRGTSDDRPVSARRQLAAFTDLASAERTYRQRASTVGEARAVERSAAPDLRVLRDGWITRDRAAGVARLATNALPRFRYPAPERGVVVSAAGDFGYAWGEGSGEAPDGTVRGARSFVRLWRRESFSGWRLVLDIALDYPPGVGPARE